MTRARGFTLLELLVAVAVFAVMAAMAYGGLSSVLNTSENAQRMADRIKAVQLAQAWFERDLGQFLDRPVRDDYGDTRPAFEIAGPEGGVFSLTRGGWRNPTGAVRSHLQRVSYGLDEEVLVRASWRSLDRPPEEEPVRADLLTGVEGLEVRVLDTQGEWNTAWPPLGTAEAAPLPVAVEVSLRLTDLGTITRLFALPQ